MLGIFYICDFGASLNGTSLARGSTVNFFNNILTFCICFIMFCVVYLYSKTKEHETKILLSWNVINLRYRIFNIHK
jgi:hypothetical protein